MTKYREAYPRETPHSSHAHGEPFVKYVDGVLLFGVAGDGAK